LFYRPELYPPCYIDRVSGQKIAFLSEPLPALRDGQLEATAESALRLQVYRGMSWGSYHRRIYYDAGRRATAEHLDWPITGYRLLPIDTQHFHPGTRGADRPVDICFVGKATPHRIAMMDFLRSASLRFVWVAHGVSGPDLAALFRRSRVVLNVHSDGVAAQEPRLYLAAACGCRVVSEPISTPPLAFRNRIVQLAGPWSEAQIKAEWLLQKDMPWTEADEAERLSLGVWRFLAEETDSPALAERGKAIAAPSGSLQLLI
jgi:hypothetical protein